MRLYTEKFKLGDPTNISFYVGLEGFYHMGFEIIEVEDFEQLEISEDHVFLGGIQFIHDALEKLEIQIPAALDYPTELEPFLGRKTWESTINEIANNPSNWNVFVKPKGLSKKFTGRYIKGISDLIGCGDQNMNTPVWVSQPKNFVAEWRAFIRYGKVVGVKSYKGDWRCNYNPQIIEEAVSAYESAPAGYSLDFGLTDKGEFLLVEANDGYALGNYGLFHTDYAKLLSARWSQLTNQQDLCVF
ncbi:MAG: ATP-grasp domain-containing protein [Flavobacteriales bacterium]